MPIDKAGFELPTSRSEKNRSPLSMNTAAHSATTRDLRQRSADTRSTRLYSATTMFDEDNTETKFYGRCATSHANGAWVRRYKSINESQMLTDFLREQTSKDKFLLRKLPDRSVFYSSSTSSGIHSAPVRRRRAKC